MTTLQAALDGCSEGAPEHAFYQKLVVVHGGSTPTPKLAKRDLDLFKLFSEVSRRGGVDVVEKKKGWPSVRKSMELPTTVNIVSLRHMYTKWLSKVAAGTDARSTSATGSKSTTSGVVAQQAIKDHGEPSLQPVALRKTAIEAQPIANTGPIAPLASTPRSVADNSDRSQSRKRKKLNAGPEVQLLPSFGRPSLTDAIDTAVIRPKKMLKSEERGPSTPSLLATDSLKEELSVVSDPSQMLLNVAAQMNSSKQSGELSPSTLKIFRNAVFSFLRLYSAEWNKAFCQLLDEFPTFFQRIEVMRSIVAVLMVVILEPPSTPLSTGSVPGSEAVSWMVGLLSMPLSTISQLPADIGRLVIADMTSYCYFVQHPYAMGILKYFHSAGLVCSSAEDRDDFVVDIESTLPVPISKALVSISSSNQSTSKLGARWGADVGIASSVRIELEQFVVERIQDFAILADKKSLWSELYSNAACSSTGRMLSLIRTAYKVATPGIKSAYLELCLKALMVAVSARGKDLSRAGVGMVESEVWKCIHIIGRDLPFLASDVGQDALANMLAFMHSFEERDFSRLSTLLPFYFAECSKLLPGLLRSPYAMFRKPERISSQVLRSRICTFLNELVGAVLAMKVQSPCEYIGLVIATMLEKQIDDREATLPLEFIVFFLSGHGPRGLQPSAVRSGVMSHCSTSTHFTNAKPLQQLDGVTRLLSCSLLGELGVIQGWTREMRVYFAQSMEAISTFLVDTLRKLVSQGIHINGTGAADRIELACVFRRALLVDAHSDLSGGIFGTIASHNIRAFEFIQQVFEVGMGVAKDLLVSAHTIENITTSAIVAKYEACDEWSDLLLSVVERHCFAVHTAPSDAECVPFSGRFSPISIFERLVDAIPHIDDGFRDRCVWRMCIMHIILAATYPQAWLASAWKDFPTARTLMLMGIFASRRQQYRAHVPEDIRRRFLGINDALHIGEKMASSIENGICVDAITSHLSLSELFSLSAAIVDPAKLLQGLPKSRLRELTVAFLKGDCPDGIDLPSVFWEYVDNMGNEDVLRFIVWNEATGTLKPFEDVVSICIPAAEKTRLWNRLVQILIAILSSIDCGPELPNSNELHDIALQCFLVWFNEINVDVALRRTLLSDILACMHGRDSQPIFTVALVFACMHRIDSQSFVEVCTSVDLYPEVVGVVAAAMNYSYEHCMGLPLLWFGPSATLSKYCHTDGVVLTLPALWEAYLALCTADIEKVNVSSVAKIICPDVSRLSRVDVIECTVPNDHSRVIEAPLVEKVNTHFGVQVQHPCPTFCGDTKRLELLVSPLSLVSVGVARQLGVTDIVRASEEGTLFNADQDVLAVLDERLRAVFTSDSCTSDVSKAGATIKTLLGTPASADFEVAISRHNSLATKQQLESCNAVTRTWGTDSVASGPDEMLLRGVSGDYVALHKLFDRLKECLTMSETERSVVLKSLTSVPRGIWFEFVKLTALWEADLVKLLSSCLEEAGADSQFVQVCESVLTNVSNRDEIVLTDRRSVPFYEQTQAAAHSEILYANVDAVFPDMLKANMEDINERSSQLFTAFLYTRAALSARIPEVVSSIEVLIACLPDKRGILSEGSDVGLSKVHRKGDDSASAMTKSRLAYTARLLQEIVDVAFCGEEVIYRLSPRCYHMLFTSLSELVFDTELWTKEQVRSLSESFLGPALATLMSYSADSALLLHQGPMRFSWLCGLSPKLQDVAKVAPNSKLVSHALDVVESYGSSPYQRVNALMLLKLNSLRVSRDSERGTIVVFLKSILEDYCKAGPSPFYPFLWMECPVSLDRDQECEMIAAFSPDPKSPSAPRSSYFSNSTSSCLLGEGIGTQSNPVSEMTMPEAACVACYTGLRRLVEDAVAPFTERETEILVPFLHFRERSIRQFTYDMFLRRGVETANAKKEVLRVATAALEHQAMRTEVRETAVQYHKALSCRLFAFT